MLTIKFGDGTIVPYTQAIEQEEFYNDASRRTLTFDIDVDAVSVDTLNALCTEENLQSLALTNDEAQITNIYEGYVLKLAVGIEPTLVDLESRERQDIIKLKLGKRTFIEQKLHELGVI